MARHPLKPLLINGEKIRRMSELVAKFDADSVIEEFFNRKLTEWLERLGYEQELEAVKALDKDDPQLKRKISAIFGIEYSGEDETFDRRRIERIGEIKTFLKQKTDDPTIIENAKITALNQEDLYELIGLNEPKIYLCGESFEIPMSAPNRHYIGILGTPEINKNASNIIFENVKVPYASVNIKNGVEINKKSTESTKKHQEFLPKSQLIDVLRQSGFRIPKKEEKTIWRGLSSSKKIIDLQKKYIFRNLFNDEYEENEIIYVYLNYKDKGDIKFSSAWALTIDSICSSNLVDKSEIIKYEDIKSFDMNKIITNDDKEHQIEHQIRHFLISSEAKIIKNFIEKIQTIKNLG